MVCLNCNEIMDGGSYYGKYCSQVCMREARGYNLTRRNCTCENGCYKCHMTKVIYTWENLSGEIYFDFFDE